MTWAWYRKTKLAINRQTAQMILILSILQLTVGAIATSVSAAEPNDYDDPSDTSNKRCFECHGLNRISDMTAFERRQMLNPKIKFNASWKQLKDDHARPLLYVSPSELSDTAHAKADCVSCHKDIIRLPHANKLAQVSCNKTCHTLAAANYRRSVHASAKAHGNKHAPSCVTCHGRHQILPKSNRKSPIHPLNLIGLCANCHEKNVRISSDGSKSDFKLKDYMQSVHGRAISKAGLLIAASCVDCHGSHEVLPVSNPLSPVHRDNVPRTCSKCHLGIAEIYAKSIHGQKVAEGNLQAPVCTDCHASHGISRASGDQFIENITAECGQCHDHPRNGATKSQANRSLYATYRQSYHGQVTNLGSSRGARCSDCHGAHDILPVSNPASRLHTDNRVRTCAKCHEGANANFAKFMPHADYTDATRNPMLHATWLYFLIIIGSTLAFFGLHSLLWFVRSWLDRAKLNHDKLNSLPPSKSASPPATSRLSIRRFSPIHIFNHALMVITFFGLTLTGMPLFFADHQWAKDLANLFGGASAAGALHRFFAIGLGINGLIHFYGIYQKIRKHSWRAVLLGPNSLLPRWSDLHDMYCMFRWFFGGPKPTFGHWTYWEKFDYWAEVFGTIVIGGTGLLLWFPIFFSKLMPGWMFNVASVVHGYEALLAICFIFTIHFFNAHLRLEKFPVDDVMFTGRLSEEEFKAERGVEYARLKAEGKLDHLRVLPAPVWVRRLAVIIGVMSMLIGTILVVLIVIAGLKVI